ncbi:MAG: sugar transferase [Anaerolineae bacterium]|nr:sugar transferase [Anaerolineae bacterium]
MLKRISVRLSLFLLTSDALLTALALHLAKLLRLTLPFGVHLDGPLAFGPWLYVFVPALWMLVFLSQRLYDTRRVLRYLEDVESVWSAVTYATLVFAGVAYLFFREFSRLLFFYFYVLDLLFLLGWRVLLREMLRLGLGRWLVEPRRVLIVGTGALGQQLGQALQAYRWAGLDPIGYMDEAQEPRAEGCAGLPVLGGLAEIESFISRCHVDEVVVTLSPDRHELVRELVLHLQHVPVNVRVVPDLVDLVFARATVEEVAGIPIIGLREPAIEGTDRVIKRLFDLVVGGLALVFFSPVIMAAALAVRLDSPGPVLLRQKRIGEGGRPFYMLKLRTMYQGAEAEERKLVQEQGAGPPTFIKRPGDPRITRVGRILRRFSIDELPQLINVLWGEMSLVGPRPELPWLVERYGPHHRKRFAVPQGMTGWWQVNGRSDRADYALRLEDDLYYIRNWSIWLDLRILWMTVGAVLRGKGAY